MSTSAPAQRNMHEPRHRPMVIPQFNPTPESLEDEIGYVHDAYMSMDANSANISIIVRSMLSRRLSNIHHAEMTIAHNEGKYHQSAVKTTAQAFANTQGGEIYDSMSEYTLYYCEGPHIVGTISTWNGNCAPGSVRIILDGEYGVVKQMEEFYRNAATRADRQLTRMYSTRHGLCESIVNFSAPKLAIDSRVLFPQMDLTPEQMIDAFVDAPDNVLILLGQPGTGKSTYVKRMLMHRVYPDDRTVIVVDSPAAIADESLISRIYSMVPGSVIIFEDIDGMLLPREDGNSGMSALLNAAEGIASPDVKFIITTNLSNLADMDHAIRRPGRCFDHIIFDKLEREQQEDILTAMGHPDERGTTAKRTLAEVMARREMSAVSTGMGFVR